MISVKKKSIRNQFYSDLVTPLEEKISHDLQHEELLLSNPEKWAEEVKRVTGKSS